jgi:hypothetical protein
MIDITYPGTNKLILPPLFLQVVFDIVYNLIKCNEPFTMRDVLLAIWSIHMPARLLPISDTCILEVGQMKVLNLSRKPTRASMYEIPSSIEVIKNSRM